MALGPLLAVLLLTVLSSGSELSVVESSELELGDAIEELISPVVVALLSTGLLLIELVVDVVLVSSLGGKGTEVIVVCSGKVVPITCVDLVVFVPESVSFAVALETREVVESGDGPLLLKSRDGVALGEMMLGFEVVVKSDSVFEVVAVVLSEAYVEFTTLAIVEVMADSGRLDPF